MANLPTRIRQSIRDEVTTPTSQLSSKFANISTTLGYPVAFEPEWPILWGVFGRHYPDPGTFVPNIVAVVLAWSDAFIRWLGCDEKEQLIDRLLDVLKVVGRLKLSLNTFEGSGQAATKFEPRTKSFQLLLPSSKAIKTSGLEAIFASNLLHLFETAEAASAVTTLADDPDWADVSMHSPVIPQVLESQLRTQSREEAFESLPDITTIDRPEELVKKPPYWIIVRQERRNLVLIEGSHGPSLALLEAYLNKWCRGEVGRVDRPPIVEIKLRESCFGLGLLYDTLVLEAGRGREITATLVLVFLENVLGYVPEPARGSAGCVWEFKRTRAFK